MSAQLYGFRWMDPARLAQYEVDEYAYVKPAIDIRVIFDPDIQNAVVLAHELTKAADEMVNEILEART